MFLQRGKGRNLLVWQLNTWMEIHGVNRSETKVFNASELSISSSVSGPEVVSWKMSRTGRGEGWRVVYLWPPTVGIVCLVVHHQLVVHKVEAVWLRLIRVEDHLAHWERKETHNTQHPTSLNPVWSDKTSPCGCVRLLWLRALWHSLISSDSAGNS